MSKQVHTYTAEDNSIPDTTKQDSCQLGKMFCTQVHFDYVNGGSEYVNGKTVQKPGHWSITAVLKDRLNRYENSTQTFSLVVEQGIGEKLAEILLPVVVADASRKAQQLADDSKTMLQQLGDRAKLCITDMPEDKQ